MFCPNCGAENSDSDVFCSNCGTSLGNRTEDTAHSGSAAQEGTAYTGNNTDYTQNNANYTQSNANYTQNNAGYEQSNANYTQNNANYVHNNADMIPEEYRPITMWGYLGYQLLFSIPCIGFVFLIVFSFGGTQNKNLQNFARSYFCLMIIVVALVALMFLLYTILGIGYAVSSSYY